MPEPRFTILTFPQRFSESTLRVRFLLLPRLSIEWGGDPRVPVLVGFPGAADTTPTFAKADWRFEARALAGLDDPPYNPVSTVPSLVAPLPTTSGTPAGAAELFETLATRFKLTNNPQLAKPVDSKIYIKKYLPGGYRNAFLFTGPRTRDAVTDDSYHCAVKEAKGPNPNFKTSPHEVSWGQVYAYCLRHSLLARKLGLVREAEIPVPPGLFENGGYLWVDLATNSAYEPQVAAQYDLIHRYAARIPRLQATDDRPLFAAVLFPVREEVAGPPALETGFDAVFVEAADYDDGFAKIVHASQPVSQNLLAEEADGFAPLTDIGIRLGWDDEQILIWQNRQLKEDSSAGPGQRLDAPMGTFAYRVDAREQSDSEWHTLMRVQSRDSLPLGDVDLGTFRGELGIEVHPMQLDGDQISGQFWLPAYLAHWNGRSLVLPDDDAARLFRTTDIPEPGALPDNRPADTDKKVTLGGLYVPEGLDQIPLRYGRTYKFRVRLVDPTGGGPSPQDKPAYESPAPVATTPFRRHVVPEAVRVAGLPLAPDENIEFFDGNTLEVSRPPLGYPAVVFTGKYVDPLPLLQAASDAAAGAPDADKGSFGIPDPDVQRVRIDVEVRALALDNLLSLSGRESYIHLYTTHREFSTDFSQALNVPLDFRDAAILNFGDPTDLGDLGLTVAQIDALEALVLPTARNIRLTLRAVADDDDAYFAAGANVGKPLHVPVRRESETETELFADFSAAKKIRGIYLQPDPLPVLDGKVSSLLFTRTTGSTPAVIQRLAQQLGVDSKGLTLVGKKGERVVFGSSRGIRHTLAPDDSSITFAAKEDLLNQWVVALTLRVDRDWTWDTLEPVSFEIFREKRFASSSDVDDNKGNPIGDWEVKPYAPIQALDSPQRDHTTLIFLDAVAPNPEGSSELPDLIELEYRVEARLRQQAVTSDPAEQLNLTLPVTTPPAQVPRIASAGLALSRYERDEKYSSTEPRQRFLWLELDEPVSDPNDVYFIRLLAYGPDPLLSDNRFETFIPPRESPLPIDPELVRVITPDQTDDRAGLDAMVPLEPTGDSDHDRHFLVPLPPGLHAESPEMFGFFTYEIRVGHAGIWSTAQGRFGRRQRSTGVQHPAPTLFCTCHRTEEMLTVEAPFAQAVLNGKNITADPPRTEIWALLYAQVRQADGKDYRNILLEDRRLDLRPRRRGSVKGPGGHPSFEFQNRDAPARGAVRWKQSEIMALLAQLGLPFDAALSVLCVEMMPTLQSLLPRGHNKPSGTVGANLTEDVRDEMAGVAGTAASTGSTTGARPLSDALGHFRILRSSSLTPVPAVCCRSCGT